MTRHRLPVLIAIAAALLSSCGGGSTGSGPSAEAAAASSGDRAMLQFAGCMRTHGVGMPDPYHRPGHSGLTLDLPEGAADTPAYTTCRHYLARIIAAKEAGAAAVTAGLRLALIRYAQCMRAHGIPMLDPDAQGQLSLGHVSGLSDSSGRYSPLFRTADEACRHLLPATVRDDGTGP